jgi:FkbM family methyltransferase
MPRGTDLFYDIKQKTEYSDFNIIFDVGAHKGETTLAFKKAFPDASIYCFEPILNNFTLLSDNLKDIGNVHLIQKALANENVVKKVKLGVASSGQTLRHDLSPESSDEIEEVTVITGQHFVDEYKLDKIDLLKIDTEGYDLEVLKGFNAYLTNGKVPFILVESGFDNRFIPLEHFTQYLEPLGFKVFGIYDQTAFWWDKNFLWNMNVLFIHESVQ